MLRKHDIDDAASQGRPMRKVYISMHLYYPSYTYLIHIQI